MSFLKRLFCRHRHWIRHDDGILYAKGFPRECLGCGKIDKTSIL
jgi:hypothetical protein